MYLSDKQSIASGGAIVRNPSPSPNSVSAISKLGTNPSAGKLKGNLNQSNPTPFSDFALNSTTPMDNVGVKINNTRTAQLADDVNLSRITKYVIELNVICDFLV